MSIEENDYLETVADGRRPSVERSMVAAQLAETILAGLDPEDRIGMSLIYSQSYSPNEVAEVIGISTSNLQLRLFRRRNRIKTGFGYLFR